MPPKRKKRLKLKKTYCNQTLSTILDDLLESPVDLDKRDALKELQQAPDLANFRQALKKNFTKVWPPYLPERVSYHADLIIDTVAGEPSYGDVKSKADKVYQRYKDFDETKKRIDRSYDLPWLESIQGFHGKDLVAQRDAVLSALGFNPPTTTLLNPHDLNQLVSLAKDKVDYAATKISDAEIRKNYFQALHKINQLSEKYPDFIKNARDAALQARTDANEAKQKFTDHQAVVKNSQHELDNMPPANAWFWSERKKQQEALEDRQKILALNQKYLSDMNVAYQSAEKLAKEAEEKALDAETQYKIAEDKKQDAYNIAIEEYTKAIAIAQEANQAFLNAHNLLDEIQLAQRAASNEKYITEHPGDAHLKRRRATLWIERNGTLGFTETVFGPGHTKTKPVAMTELKDFSKLILTSTLPKSDYRAVHVGTGEEIHAVAKAENYTKDKSEIRIVQTSYGDVIDQSTGKTPRDKEIAALKQAKMRLLTGQKPIHVLGGKDEHDQNRVIAALIALIDNNPHLDFTIKDIIPSMKGTGPGFLESKSAFIERYLGNIQSERLIEQDDLSQKAQEIKDLYLGVIKTKDLPEEPEDDPAYTPRPPKF